MNWKRVIKFVRLRNEVVAGRKWRDCLRHKFAHVSLAGALVTRIATATAKETSTSTSSGIEVKLDK